MTEFGPQRYSVFFCVVSNSDCHKKSALGRDGKSNDMENRNEAKEFYWICFYKNAKGNEMTRV